MSTSEHKKKHNARTHKKTRASRSEKRHNKRRSSSPKSHKISNKRKSSSSSNSPKRYNKRRSSTSHKRSNKQKSHSIKSTKSHKHQSRKNKRGGNISAAELLNKYQSETPKELVSPDTNIPTKSSRSNKDIQTLRNANVNKCQSKFTLPQVKKCSTVVSLPQKRQECRKMADEVVNGINTLTNKYKKDIDDFTKKCGDKQLTDKQMKDCEQKLAELTQEYVAQCSTMSNAIELNFGSKTIKGRIDSVKKILNKGVDLLPGQKDRRQATELKKQFGVLVDQWVTNCKNNSGLEKAQGMEFYNMKCTDFNKSYSKDEIVDSMIKRVKNN